MHRTIDTQTLGNNPRVEARGCKQNLGANMDNRRETHTRKRKRRRGVDRPPLPAQLLVDGRIHGDVGLLSGDLFGNLYPALSVSQGIKDPSTLKARD